MTEDEAWWKTDWSRIAWRFERLFTSMGVKLRGHMVDDIRNDTLWFVYMFLYAASRGRLDETTQPTSLESAHVQGFAAQEHEVVLTVQCKQVLLIPGQIPSVNCLSLQQVKSCHALWEASVTATHHPLSDKHHQHKDTALVMRPVQQTRHSITTHGNQSDV